MTILYVVRLSYEDLSDAYVGPRGRVLALAEAEVFHDRALAQRTADQWRDMLCDAFPVEYRTEAARKVG